MSKLDTHSQQGDDQPENVLSRLITEQGITPIDNLDQLSALWPADDDPDALMNFVLSEGRARLQLD